MQQAVPKASGSGLTKLRKKEEWAAKEIDLTDDRHKVSQLPKSPNCSSLIALYLQGNYELTAIPPLFFQRMALLQVLDLSRTSIKSLPKSLPKLVALKKLLLQGCDLFMELSPQVGKLKNLEELDLDETQIMDLPREIGKLLKLKQLKVSFYHIRVKKKSKSNIVIHPETISNLSQLAELSIDVNPADKRWDDSVEAVVKEVCNSKTLRTLNLYLPKFQLLDNTSLLYPSLSRFRFTVGHHNRRIISRVPHAVEAEFRNWDKCLKFVNGENIPNEIKGVLEYSTSFFLDHHATAVNLSEFGVENMKGLKFCLLAECNKMETLIDGEMHCERSEDDKSKSDPGSVEHVLESLEYLSIYYMENLQSIWRGPNHFGCMCKLKFLALHTCPQLSKIFSHALLENFVDLEEIILEDCPQVTSLVSHASVKPMMSDKIFLPSLKRLLLLYLPELVSISNGLLIAPKLESLGCYNCPKLKSISKMELSSKTLKVIKGECQWWENMNWDEAEWGNRPDYLMHIFSPIDKVKDVMTQMAEDRDLLEVTIQNEGQQQGDEKLLKFSTQDQNDQQSEERITGTDVTKSPLACILPSSPLRRMSDAPEQGWSFSSEKNRSLEFDYFDLASEICEVDVDEDEPKAKRWNCFENGNEGAIGSARISQPSTTIIQSAPEPSRSFSPEKSKSLEDDYFGLASEICEVHVDESEPKAKRWNCIENKNKGAIGSASKTMRGHRATVRIRSKNEVPADGHTWRKYGQKIIKGNPHERCYYRCSTWGCPMRKWIERDSKDTKFLIITYEGIHDHHEHYVRGLCNWHSELCNDGRANNVEDAAEAAKTVSPKKGYRDVFEASIQDKEYARTPVASIRDESQKSEDEDILEVLIQSQDQQPDRKVERTRTNVINISLSTPPTMSPPVAGLMASAKLPDHPVLMDNSNVLPSPNTGEFAGQLLNQKSNSGNDQQSISQEDNNSSDVCHLPLPSPTTTSSIIPELSAAILPTVRLQAQSFEELAENNQSKGNLQSQAHYDSCYGQDSDLVKSRKSADAYTLKCHGIENLIENRRRSFYNCADPGCRALKLVERSLDGQITKVIHSASHNNPESQPTSRTSSLSAFSSIIRASNHLTIKIPDGSIVTYEGGQMDADGLVSFTRSVMDENGLQNIKVKKAVQSSLRRKPGLSIDVRRTKEWKPVISRRQRFRKPEPILVYGITVNNVTDFTEMNEERDSNRGNPENSVPMISSM